MQVIIKDCNQPSSLVQEELWSVSTDANVHAISVQVIYRLKPAVS